MEPERRDVGETAPERVEREEEATKEVRGKWRSDLILVAALLIALLALGWWQNDRFSDDLRNAAVSGCERQNEVRQLFRAARTDDIRDVKKSRSHRDYPDIPIDRFRRLKGDRIVTLRMQRASIPDTDCEAAFPD